MKAYLSVIILFLFVFSATAQQENKAKAKLSPLTKKYIHELKKSQNQDHALAGFLYKNDSNGQLSISALIKVVNGAPVEQKIKTLGGNVGTKAGNIWTVRIPANKAIELSEVKGILYLQMDEPVRPLLDIARKTTRVDSVQKGINLPLKYSGDGVVLGVIDFGFDYNHPTFYDTLRANYRIKKVWELNGTGTPPAGYTYGNELIDSLLIQAQGTDNAAQTHGTCVAGMAAGSGFGSNATNAKYRGMAYEAELVFVGVRRDTIATQWLQGSFTDFLDGINYIFNYAQSVGKPCVINISWGSQSGPHDGSTLLNQACNNLTGPGKILVMSAGNEGEEKIHLSKTFTPTDTIINTFLTFTSETYKRTWVDIWGDPGKTFCGEVSLYHHGVKGNTTNYFCIDDSIHDQLLISDNGQDTCLVQFITSAAEANGKPRMTIDIYNKSADTVAVSLKGFDGTINAWDEYYFYGYTYGYQSAFNNGGQSWAENGNTITTVSDMGAADSVLLVGAYASKVGFTDVNSNSWSYSGYVQANKLVPFSSRGPLIDGRIKPDITAPGLTIATAVSSYDTSYTSTGSNSSLTVKSFLDSATNKTFYFCEFSGTSASAPAASGIVALLLQAKPTMGPKEIQDIIASTAITDTHTGTIPAAGNNNWGHGKINAYKAIKKVLGITGIYTYSGKKLACELYPNPNNGLFTLSFAGDIRNKLQVEIFNNMGQLLQSENWQTDNGDNLHTIDISNMAKGIYLIRVASAEGFVTIKTFKE